MAIRRSGSFTEWVGLLTPMSMEDTMRARIHIRKTDRRTLGVAIGQLQPGDVFCFPNGSRETIYIVSDTPNVHYVQLTGIAAGAIYSHHETRRTHRVLPVRVEADILTLE